MRTDYKIKIIVSLFAVATLLVAAILILNYVESEANGKNEAKKRASATVYPAEAKRKFLSAFEIWGFDEDWIVAVKVDPKKNETGEIYRITFPKNVPVDFILLELNEIFLREKNVKVFAKDLPKRRKTKIIVKTGPVVAVAAYAETNGKLERKNIFASFVYDGRESDAEEFRPNNFVKTVLIRIGSEELKKAKLLKKNGFACAPIIDDEISEYKYSLAPSLSTKELNSSVYRIVRDFGKDEIYFFDSKSELCRAASFEYVKKRFRKYVRFLNLNYMHDLCGKSEAEIKTAVRLVLKSEKANVFLLSPEQFIPLRKFFTELWKKGVRFLPLTDYVKSGATHVSVE